jgi:hypothetical protein
MSLSPISQAPAFGQTLRNVNENAGLTMNRQSQLNEMNKKTGMNYDLQKEASATNAKMIVDIFV